MAALSHGWKPPAGSDVAKIPLSVAKEFHAADKAKSKRESIQDHPSRKE